MADKLQKTWSCGIGILIILKFYSRVASDDVVQFREPKTIISCFLIVILMSRMKIQFVEIGNSKISIMLLSRPTAERNFGEWINFPGYRVKWSGYVERLNLEVKWAKLTCTESIDNSLIVDWDSMFHKYRCGCYECWFEFVVPPRISRATILEFTEVFSQSIRPWVCTFHLHFSPVLIFNKIKLERFAAWNFNFAVQQSFYFSLDMGFFY